MKCIEIFLLSTLIGILLVAPFLFPSCPQRLLVLLPNCAFSFEALLFQRKNMAASADTKSNIQGGPKQEIISLKVITSRSRREAGNAVVLELFRPQKNETMTVHVSDNSEILAPDFVLFLDGQELEPPQLRPKRSAKTLMENLQNRFYAGTVSSQSGSFGRAALTSFPSPEDESEGFFGLLSLDGVNYLIEPSTQPSGTEGSLRAPHILIQANADNNGRKCASRGINPLENVLSTEELHETEGETFKNASHRLEVKFEAKNQVKKGKAPLNQGRVLELALYADSALFQKMKKKFPKRTLQNTVTYILASVNNMNLLYKDPSIGYDNKIDIRLNYLEVLTKNPKKLNDAKGRESIYLESFCKFAASKNTDVTNWDHAMMLTGTDLRAADSAGVIGVAFTGAVCDNRYSCSLIEASNFLGTYTMAHELGHSLGMNHDGEENNAYCNPSKYIMAPMEGGGQLTWSICSQQNLRDFLNRRSSIPSAANPGCLRTTSKRKKRKKPINYKKKKLPGEIYSAAQQCAMSLGKKFSKPVFQVGYYESICYELKCGDGTKTVGTQPALEGTLCGKQMWCKAGSCVAKPI